MRISDEEAPALSAALAELLVVASWRVCRDAVMEAYPVQRRQRRERFAGRWPVCVIAAAELDAELPELMLTLESLGMKVVSKGPEALLEQLRQGVMGQADAAGQAQSLQQADVLPGEIEFKPRKPWRALAVGVVVVVQPSPKDSSATHQQFGTDQGCRCDSQRRVLRN